MAAGAGMGCVLRGENGPVIQRNTPLKRSGITRRTRIKWRRTIPRRVSVLRDQKYKDWLKERNCILKSFWSCEGPIDPAHTVGNGRGSKGPDSSCVPLCRKHHDEMDGRLNTQITTKAKFAEKYEIDLAKESAAHYATYLIDTGKV
jgi:hypothetical protein